MQLLMRIVVGIVSALSLLLMGAIWLHPDMAGARLGLSAVNTVGMATLRADVAGFFGAGGLFALGAALRNEARYAGVAAALLAAALAGRIVDIAMRGWSPLLLPSILVEAVLIALFVLAYRTLDSARR